MSLLSSNTPASEVQWPPGAGLRKSPTETSQTKLLRFGEFEADLLRGELRRNGMRIELRGQLMEMLRVFLERPGELITQEEFRKLLWPGNVNVGFEQSVYTAVKQLREVLGDSASRPRYIETRARRGYRFIAPVNVWRVPAAEPLEIQLGEDARHSSIFTKWLRGCLCIPRGWAVLLLLAMGAGFWLVYRLF